MWFLVWCIVAATIARDVTGCLAVAIVVGLVMILRSPPFVIIPLAWLAFLIRNEISMGQTVGVPELLPWLDQGVWMVAAVAVVWPKSSLGLLALYLPLAMLTRPHKPWEVLSIVSALFALLVSAAPANRPALLIYATAPLVVAFEPSVLQISAIGALCMIVDKFTAPVSEPAVVVQKVSAKSSKVVPYSD